MPERPRTGLMGRSAIPAVVLARICQHLHLDHAQRTLRDMMLASRESYEIAAPLVYLDVYIEPSSVDSLMWGLELTSEAPGPLQGSRYPWHHDDYDHAGFSARILAQMDDRRTDQSNGTPRPRPFKATPEKEEEREFREMLGEAEKARLGEYLRSITTAEPTLSLPTDMLGDSYPNLISHARKLALFHRTTRVIVSDDISAEVVYRLHHLARATKDLLFPSVRTLVVKERDDGPFTSLWPGNDLAGHVALRQNFLKAIDQMACPTNICVWDDIHLFPQDDSPQSYQGTRPNPGRVQTYNFHRVHRQASATFCGATNRYYFTFDPESAARAGPDDKVTRKSNALYERMCRARIVSSLVMQAAELSTGARTTLVFIDPGRLRFIDNASMVEIGGKTMVQNAISDYYVDQECAMEEDEGQSIDGDLDRVLQMVSHRLGGDVEDCEGCCDSFMTRMILGLGVDILSLARFEAVISRRGVQRVARRVCCARELADFHAKFGNDHQVWVTRDDAWSFSPAIEAQAAYQENEMIKRRVLRFLSSRWAIKEAAYKALTPVLPLLRTMQPDLRLTFHSFDLVHTRGAPRLDMLRMTDGKGEAERMEGISLMSSLSHDAGVVVGVVLAQQNATSKG